MFLASDFAWSAVQSPLEAAGRYAKTGDPKHMWIATQDVFPDAAKAMQEGYIDVGTTYDAFYHAKEAIRVIILIAEKKPLDAGRTAASPRGGWRHRPTSARWKTSGRCRPSKADDMKAGPRPANGAQAGACCKEKHDGNEWGAERSAGLHRQGGAGDGGAAGIGHAVAEAFAERGAQLALADRDAGTLEIAAAPGCRSSSLRHGCQRRERRCGDGGAGSSRFRAHRHPGEQCGRRPAGACGVVPHGGVGSHHRHQPQGLFLDGPRSGARHAGARSGRISTSPRRRRASALRATPPIARAKPGS